MKKHVLICWFSLGALSSFAQTLFNFDNANWYIMSNDWNAEEFKVTSKEVFQTCAKIGKIDSSDHVFYKINTTLPFILEGKPQKQFFLRQDNATGKVFLRSFQEDEKEYLLYDFNLKVGDTIQSILTNQLDGKLIVSKVTMAGTTKFPMRLIEAKLNGDSKSKTFKFMEGVGSMHGFLVNLSTDSNGGTMLKCLHFGNELIYSQGNDCPATPKLKLRPTKSK